MRGHAGLIRCGIKNNSIRAILYCVTISISFVESRSTYAFTLRTCMYVCMYSRARARARLHVFIYIYIYIYILAYMIWIHAGACKLSRLCMHMYDVGV
jgi:hypothetical protein